MRAGFLRASVRRLAYRGTRTRTYANTCTCKQESYSEMMFALVCPLPAVRIYPAPSRMRAQKWNRIRVASRERAELSPALRCVASANRAKQTQATKKKIPALLKTNRLAGCQILYVQRDAKLMHSMEESQGPSDPRTLGPRPSPDARKSANPVFSFLLPFSSSSSSSPPSGACCPTVPSYVLYKGCYFCRSRVHCCVPDLGAAKSSTYVWMANMQPIHRWEEERLYMLLYMIH